MSRVAYEAWMAEIDRILLDNAGLGLDCLAPIPYWDQWNLDISPLEAARKIVRAEWGDRAPEILDPES